MFIVEGYWKINWDVDFFFFKLKDVKNFINFFIFLHTFWELNTLILLMRYFNFFYKRDKNGRGY